MLMLDIFFVVISAYLLCGWFQVEKYLSADKETSNKKFFFNYYLWPIAAMNRK